jgi:seryl-tRNA synthetase
MLTLKILREHPDYVIERLAVRNMDAGPIVKQIVELDVRRRAAQTQSDALTAEQKKIAAGIGKLMQEGKKAEAEEIKKQAAQTKEKIKELNQEQESLEKELNDLLITLPNIPYKLVVPGKGEDENVLVREGGMIPELSSDALPHWELAKKYDLIDFDLGV